MYTQVHASRIPSAPSGGMDEPESHRRLHSQTSKSKVYHALTLLGVLAAVALGIAAVVMIAQTRDKVGGSSSVPSSLQGSLQEIEDSQAAQNDLLDRLSVLADQNADDHASFHDKQDEIASGVESLLQIHSIVAQLPSPSPSAAVIEKGWTNWGGGIHNQRVAVGETKITTDNVGNLAISWNTSGEGVQATPTTTGDHLVYYPTWKGEVVCRNRINGSLVWTINVTAMIMAQIPGYAPMASLQQLASRTSVILSGSKAFFATRAGALVFSVNRYTGALLWATRLDSHPAAIITQSGTYYDGSVYFGVSSAEEEISETVANFTCCTFRGSFQKLDANTGTVQWTTYMSPANGGQTGGYAGAAVWGSAPAIDVKRNLVVIATGNLYSVPPAVESCITNAETHRNITFSDPCRLPGDYSNSFVAMDIDSGKVSWFNPRGAIDVWTLSCGLSIYGGLWTVTPKDTNCPETPGPDYDFAQAPMFIPGSHRTPEAKDVLIAGQKSGEAFCVLAESGNLQWARIVGPGGIAGGVQWGSTTDGKNAYFVDANTNPKNYTLMDNSTTIGGVISAVDIKSGTLLWQYDMGDNVIGYAALSLANGVLFTGEQSILAPGTVRLLAIDASTGILINSWTLGNGIVSGPMIYDGTVYVGSGSTPSGGGLYAFSLVNA